MPASKKAMDFTNVKDNQFNPKRVPAGDYVMKILSVEDSQSNAGNDQWVFTCVITSDKSARPATYPYYCGHDAKNAWKIRKLFIACGRPVPKRKVMVDPNKLVGGTFGAALDDDEYEGRLKSTIADVFPAEDVSDTPVDDDDDQYEDDVEETPPPRKRAAAKKTASRRAPEPDDDDDDDGVDEAPPSRKRAPAKKAARRRQPEPDDDDMTDDDLDLDEL